MTIIKWKHEYTVVVLFLLTELLLIGFVNYNIFSNIKCLLHIVSAISLIIVWIDYILRNEIFWGALVASLGMFFPHLFHYEEYGRLYDRVETELFDLFFKVGGCVGLILLVIIFCKNWDKSDRMKSVIAVVVSFVVFITLYHVVLSSINILSVPLPAETAEYEVSGECEYAQYSNIYPVKTIGKNNSNFEKIGVSRVYDLLPGDKITIEYHNGIFYDMYKVIEIDPERFAEE